MQIAALFCLLLALLCRPVLASNCPDLSQGESAQDCPWAELARHRLVNLKKSAPDLYRQIRSDSRHAVLKSLWGESSNFDELAKARIVDPEILRTLAKLMGVSWISDRICLAGLEHTYGYLFSTLKTSFGYKRDRWVSGKIEGGFGLDKGLLSPDAPSSGGGTLFSNVTYFFGRIAFRDNVKRLKELEGDSSGVAAAIRNFNYDSIKPVRLEEIIPSQRILIHTDLVPFPMNPEHELLVYSIVRQGSAHLITGFPVTKKFAESLLEPDHSGGGLGDDLPIVTRYNAYVEGITGKKFTGTRRVVMASYVDWRKHDAHTRH